MNFSGRRKTLISMERHLGATRSISCLVPNRLSLVNNSVATTGACSQGHPIQTRDFSNHKRFDAMSKKKKFFSSPQPPVYGTPETGLILPPKGVIHQEEQPQETNSLVASSNALSAESNASQLFSPLMDRGQADSNSDFDASHQSFENTDLSLSSHQTSAPDMFDLASMYDPRIHLPLKPDFSDPNKNYEVATPLGEELMKYIGVLGAPITLAEYMKRCLRDEKHGYYTNPPMDHDDFDDNDDGGDDDLQAEQGRGHRLIGQAGDFTTAPEISQIFGECVAIWLLTQYKALGKPSRIQLVELGPGRGTLMSDILRSAYGIKGAGEEFVNALTCGSDPATDSHGNGKEDGIVQGVHFVEVSENLRITQREALQKLQKSQNVDESVLSFDFIQWKTQGEKLKDVEELMSKLRERKSTGKEVDTETLTKLIEKQRLEKREGASNEATTGKENASTIPIQWHDSFDSVPFTNMQDGSSIPTFIIGQEFLDALPVHVFQKTDQGWREHMVDVAVDEDEDEDNTAEVHMRDGTIAKTKAPTSMQAKQNSAASNEHKKIRFRHVLSPGVTPALRNLLHTDDDGTPIGTPSQANALNDAPVGTIMEVCPEGLALVQDLALRIEECKGSALMIDYGNEGSRDTLRAFRKHQQVDMLSRPGTVDITADVDFGALRNAVNYDLSSTRKKSKQGDREIELPEAFGPQKQGQFLASMGAVERTLQLIEDDSTTDDQAEELYTALKRLLSEEDMGERFKVLAIAHKKDGIFPPAGF